MQRVISPSFRRLIGLLLLSSGQSITHAQTPVEPLLQKYCLGCHNESNKEGGLSLQTLDSLKKGGDNGLVRNAEDPSSSLLMKVLADKSENPMPPEGEPQPTAAEKELLRKWVLAGASIRDMATGKPDVPQIEPVVPVAPSLLASAALSEEQVVVGGGRHVAAINIKSGKTVWKSEFEDVRISSLVVASTEPWILAGSGLPGVDGKALLLSQKDGQVLNEFGGHTDAVYAAVINQQQTRIATAGYDRRILIHDVASGQILKTLEGHNGAVFSLAFDPAGEVLCSASADGTVKVWHVETGERLDTLSQPTREQYDVLVEPSGQRIFAAGADNRIRMWRLVSRKSTRINPIIASRFAHEKAITELAISADGSRLASVAEDGTLQVWSTAPFAHFQTLPTQQSPVTSLTFVSPTQLFLTHLDGSFRSLPVSSTPTTKAPIGPGTATAKVDLPDDLKEVPEQEPNNKPDQAQQIPLPAMVQGTIDSTNDSSTDVDQFQFSAVAGQQLVLEIKAGRDKSLLDSKIEVLTADGQRILQAKLQAVRDSYFTFRGKDSDTSDDFRLFNWQEMELNEFLYSDGEVVRLWHYPRGPDSGFMVYPGFGRRHTFFHTTPTSHALQAPCFIVRPVAPDAEVTANGLPVFPLYFENDDDPLRTWGRDSRLMFTAPADGTYVAQVTDARGFGGSDYSYKLTVRAPKPDFKVTANTKKFTLAAGTGREVMFSADRIDGYSGPITIDVRGLPAGYTFSGPIQIEEDQYRAFGTIFANQDAQPISDEDQKQIEFIAATEAHGERSIATVEELKLADETKLKVTITQEDKDADDSVELVIRPGETIRAFVKLDRQKHDGVVSFGKSDAGRNLPHGVYVDNIGLNGLLLLAGQSEREFFITASKIARPGTSTFFLKSNVDGITSQPVTLRIVPADSEGQQVTTR